MKIEFTCNDEDRKEAQRALKSASVLWRPAGFAKRFLMFLALIGAAALVYFVGHQPTPVAISGVTPLTVETEAWLLLLPAAIVPIYYILIYIVALILPVSPERRFVRHFKKSRLKPARTRMQKLRERIIAGFGLTLLAGILLIVVIYASKDVPTVNPPVVLLGGAFLFGYHFALLIIVVLLINWVTRRFREREFTTWLNSMSNWQRVISEFDDHGIELVRDQMRAHYAWSACRQFIETENLYVLTFAYEAIEIIPKRAFCGIEEDARFLTLLMEKAGNGFIIERPAHGFPVQPVPLAKIAPPPTQPAQ